MLAAKLESGSILKGRQFFGPVDVKYVEGLLRIIDYSIKAGDQETYCEDLATENRVHLQMRYINSGERPNMSVEGIGAPNLSCFFGTLQLPTDNKQDSLFLCSSQGLFAETLYAFQKKLQIELGQMKPEICEVLERKGVEKSTCFKVLTQFADAHLEPEVFDTSLQKNNGSAPLTDRH